MDAAEQKKDLFTKLGSKYTSSQTHLVEARVLQLFVLQSVFWHVGLHLLRSMFVEQQNVEFDSLMLKIKVKRLRHELRAVTRVNSYYTNCKLPGSPAHGLQPET